MKKHQQLGMNTGTASNRLVKDLLFSFAVAAGHKCHRCAGDLTRDSFSIEHKEAWLDSDDPVGRFFDLSNIGFSHKSCNSAAKRTPHKRYHTIEDRRAAQQRFQRESNARTYTPEKRRARYLAAGN